MYYNKIHNPYNVKIEKRKIYNDIYEYRIVDDGYYFESCGVSYGVAIYQGETFNNYYVIRKRKKDGTIHKEL